MEPGTCGPHEVWSGFIWLSVMEVAQAIPSGQLHEWCLQKEEASPAASGPS